MSEALTLSQYSHKKSERILLSISDLGDTLCDAMQEMVPMQFTIDEWSHVIKGSNLARYPSSIGLWE